MYRMALLSTKLPSLEAVVRDVFWAVFIMTAGFTMYFVANAYGFWPLDYFRVGAPFLWMPGSGSGPDYNFSITGMKTCSLALFAVALWVGFWSKPLLLLGLVILLIVMGLLTLYTIA